MALDPHVEFLLMLPVPPDMKPYKDAVAKANNVVQCPACGKYATNAAACPHCSFTAKKVG